MCRGSRRSASRCLALHARTTCHMPHATCTCTCTTCHADAHAQTHAARTRFSAGVISSLVFFFSFLLLLPHALSSAAACRGDAKATQARAGSEFLRERVAKQGVQHTPATWPLSRGRAYVPALRQPPCAPQPLRPRRRTRPLSCCPWRPSPTLCPCAPASCRAPPPPSRAAPPWPAPCSPLFP